MHVILHIGQHKTGSKALQSALYANRELLVRDDEPRVDLIGGTEAVARRAGAVWRVEGEVSGREFVETLPIAWPGEVLTEHLDLRLGRFVSALRRDDLDFGHSACELEGRFHRLGEASLDPIASNKPIDDDRNVVLFVTLELGEITTELNKLTVDDGTGESLTGEISEQGVVGSLAAAHDRG